MPDVSLNCLIPVKFVCEKRGCPSEFSIICLPKSEEDFINAVESICEDEFEAKRKELRRTHKQLLQKLKKQRKQKIKRLVCVMLHYIGCSFFQTIHGNFVVITTSVPN